MTTFETAAGDRYVKWISHYRAKDPLFRHPCRASQLKERRRYHEPCAYLFLLGAWLDVHAGAFRRDENGRQSGARAGMRHQYSVTGDVAEGGEASAAHRQKSGAGAQDPAVPLRAG